MELPKVIDQLEELIADRESFIYSDGEARGIYIADKEALEEAVKVLTVIRDKRQVTFTVYPEGVFYDAKEPEGHMWCRGILMEPEEDRPHIKTQYKGEELTIKELTDRLDKASADRDRYKRLSETRKKQIDELEKQIEDARPLITREAVKEIWKGEWEFPIFADGSISDIRCKCPNCASIEAPLIRHNFCPSCGEAMTEKAVDMVMERLEALQDADD